MFSSFPIGDELHEFVSDAIRAIRCWYLERKSSVPALPRQQNAIGSRSRIDEPDRIQRISCPARESDRLISGRDFNPKIPAPAATAEQVGRSFVGVYPQGIDGVAVPSRQRDDILIRVEEKHALTPAGTAVPISFN